MFRVTSLIITLALASSSLSTKAAGLAWLLFILLGIASWLNNKRFSENQTINLSSGLTTKLSAQWLLVCIFALVFIFIPTAYWGGPWPERHPQVRLLLGALGAWLLINHVKRSQAKHVNMWILGGAVGLGLAFLGVIFKGSSAIAPTNRIPWMAGLSVFSCALLGSAYAHAMGKLWIRRVAIFMCLLTPVTAFLSGVRGSWMLLVVLPLAFFVLHKNQTAIAKPVLRWLIWVPLGIAAFVFAAGIHFDNPFLRIEEFYQSLVEFLSSSVTASTYDSSIGVRLGMYQEGLKNALHSGWLGYGHAEHKRILAETFLSLGVDHFASQLGHYHNDLFNAWSELGSLGMMSYLTYMIGLIYISKKLWSSQRASSVCMWALTLMHVTTGLTNMNFAHNYYPLMLSLSVTMLLTSLVNQES